MSDTPSTPKPNAGANPPPLLTTREVCRQLNISRATLDRHVRKGAIPAPVKIGRGPNPMLRWRASDVHAIIHGANTAAPDTAAAAPDAKEAA